MGKTITAKSESGATKKARVAPFKQDSREFKFLVKLFQDGKIKPSEQPASVQSKYLNVFGQFTASQFCSQYSKARNFAGVNCKF
jgi:hypothetical protein